MLFRSLGRIELAHLRATVATERAQQSAAIVAQKAQAAATEATWKGKIDEAHAQADAERASGRAALDAALRSLRNRAPHRADLPQAAADVCAGASPAALSSEDAGVAIRLASEADDLRTAYSECKARVEAMTAHSGK